MIKLNLSIEELFPCKKKLVKRYNYESDKMNYDFIDSLEGGIFGCLGDGMTFDFIEFDKNYYIDVSIIVSSIELDKKEGDNKRVKDVLTFLDSILKKNLEVNEDKNFLLDYVNIFQESPDGYLITIEDNSGSFEIQISEIVEFFNDNKIKYNLLSTHERRSECGSSGIYIKILIFLVESVGGGMFYDGIKKLWQRKFSDSVKLSNPRKVDAKKFNEFQKILALRIKSNTKNLILCRYKNNDEKTIEMIFKDNEKTVTIITDTDYVIKKMKVLPNE